MADEERHQRTHENKPDDEPIGVNELARVAMFPLPNMVLLPGALMPLHIFEPRYREMTRDVLDGNRLIAMARLQEGYDQEYHLRPPVHSTIGVGRVVDSYELPDGRYDILVRGLVRTTLVEELPAVRAYREVRLDQLADRLVGEPAVLDAARTKLVELCDRLSEHIDQGGAELRALVRSADSPGGCADILAAVLVADPDVRQGLLENRDPLERLEHAMQVVNRLLHEVAPESDSPGSRN